MIVLNKKKVIIVLILIVLILIVLCAAIAVVAPPKIIKLIYKKEYSEYVEKYSEEYGVDKNLVYAVIKAESNFNSDAKSGKDAIGLMQLIKSTAQEVAKKAGLQISNGEMEEQLLNPDININIGTKYLSYLIDRYKNVEIAVTAYNAGIGTVDNWIEKGIIKADGSDIENVPYKETNNYVRKILRDYKIYSNTY